MEPSRKPGSQDGIGDGNPITATSSNPPAEFARVGVPSPSIRYCRCGAGIARDRPWLPSVRRSATVEKPKGIHANPFDAITPSVLPKTAPHHLGPIAVPREAKRLLVANTHLKGVAHMRSCSPSVTAPLRSCDRRNLLVRLCVCMLLLWSPSASTSETARTSPENALPATIPRLEPLPEAPLFVSLEAAFSAEGEPDRRLFTEDMIQSLAKLEYVQRKVDVGKASAPAPATGTAPVAFRGAHLPYPSDQSCPLFTVSPSLELVEPLRSRETTADAIAVAKAIYRGRITAGLQGFFDGKPGTLLRVDLDETLRASDFYAPTDHLYVHYPYGVFAKDGVWFCGTQRGYDYRPAIGDSVFLFPTQRPRDLWESVLYLYPEEILAYTRDGLRGPLAEHDPVLQGVGTIEAARAHIEAILLKSSADQPKVQQ